MGKSYPQWGYRRRPPNPKKEGKKGIGKPCIVCGTWTIGQAFIEVNCFRGDDELVYACMEHCNARAATELIEAWQSKPEQQEEA